MSDLKMASVDDSGFVTKILHEIVTSPLNVLLLSIITVLIYKVLKSRRSEEAQVEPEPELPKLRKDFTAEELKAYDGNGPDRRILMAVNGQVFDVSRGKRFYGPGGPYAVFAGRDASRGLATFDLSCTKIGYDDLSDLSPMEMESVKEWEMQFKEKYEYVGRLLKEGEQPTNYSEEEEKDTDTSSTEKSKDEEKKTEEKKTD